MLNSLYDFKRNLVEQNVFFCFSGFLSQTLLVEIGNSLRNKMAEEKTDFSTVLKVFSILVEQVQNILHYSNERIDADEHNGETMSNGIIVVGHEMDNFYILCGNTINNHDTLSLAERLEHIQRMDKTELKSYYKQQRRQTSQAESKGAGLGFIELARKASSPIEYSFQPLDAENTFFSLKTRVSK